MGKSLKEKIKADAAKRVVVKNNYPIKQLKAYAWLPWTCFFSLLVSYVWMQAHPNGKTFDIFCNITTAVGVVLIAGGAVVQPEMRKRLFEIKNYDATIKVEHGAAPKPPVRLTDAEIAKFFVEASDNSEAGTMLAVFGTIGLVFHLIADL